ncbi:MAG: hypothetical protein ABSB97_03155 [Thermoplasmata archaeon]|jgi:hypothetical protein
MALAPFSTVDRSALRWQRTADTPMEFTLSSGETPVARLRWAHAGGSLASVELDQGSWTLKRGGFLNPNITARAAGSGETLARLSVHLNHHSIELPGGATFRFHRAGVLLPAWKISRDDGQEVLHIEPVREGRKLEGGAVIAPPEATNLSELLLLTVIAWHFIVLAWFEDEALVPLEGP